MSDLKPVGAPGAVVGNDVGRATTPSVKSVLLPEPTASAFMGEDPLAQMMLAMQQASDTSLSLSTLRIHDTQAAVHEKLEDFLEKLQEMCDKLRAAQEEDDDSWFGDCFDFIGDIVGEIAGTLTDLQVDLATLPVDIVVDVAKNITDPAAMMQALQATGGKLFENGSTAEDVHGFTQGVVSFAADFTELTARMQVALAKGALSGEALDEAILPELKKLGQSAQRNLLDNPHFWAVVSAAAKAAAVASVAASGGALAPVALGLMVLMEADQRWGVIETVVGKDAAPAVRLGVGLTTAVCCAFSSGANNQVLDLVNKGTALLKAANSGYQAYRTLQLGEEQAEQLEDQAELTSTLNNMQRLQRLLDNLLASLGDDQKDHEQTQELGAGVLQTKMAGDMAAVLPA
ncbi:MAG TPA: hypothetical protein VG937_01200 [Polyangiaceae bacterium]|nr:hypothetical protein [Polyangiaceae bacterium]